MLNLNKIKRAVKLPFYDFELNSKLFNPDTAFYRNNIITT
jgi:hypothetical protein